MWHMICYRQESKDSLIKRINNLCMAAEELNSSFEEILTCMESSEVCCKSTHSSGLTIFEPHSLNFSSKLLCLDPATFRYISFLFASY